MNYLLSNTPAIESNDCLVLGFSNPAALKNTFEALGMNHCEAYVQRAQALEKAGEWLSFLHEGHTTLVVFQCDDKTYHDKTFVKRMNEVGSLLLRLHAKKACICLPSLKEQTPNWQLEQSILALEQCFYQFNDYKSERQHRALPETLCLCIPKADASVIEGAKAIAHGIAFTRTLADRPANDCTPTYLAEQAIALSKQHPNLKTMVLEEHQMRELGMNTLLAVSKGSEEPPKLIELNYQGGEKGQAPIVLVGKGITFDSGGISLKPAAGMGEMKYDMGGAASVLGTIKAIAEMKLAVNVIGLLACAENLPSGRANKPGDVVKSMAGITVEITNTDAEGRLVLADALTYAKRYEPKMVLDIATLTGAMVIALGGVHTGYMTKDECIARALEEAAKQSNDSVWRMPLDEAYHEALESPIADMVNATMDRVAGSITAACFLSKFTEEYRWAHLDIAGTAWISGKKHHATGRPVALLVEWIRHVSNTR